MAVPRRGALPCRSVAVGPVHDPPIVVGDLAARGESGARTRWPGRGLFGHAGAGVRLLRWLQQLADDQHATIVIATTVPRLVGYYQRAGFTVESERWLRLGEIVVAGKAVLSY